MLCRLAKVRNHACIAGNDAARPEPSQTPGGPQMTLL